MSESLSRAKRDLYSYALEYGGRFILFGSVARGDFRPDSDVDILVDFPKEYEAWGFAEDICAKYHLKGDVRSIRFCGAGFIDHIMKEAEVIHG